MESPPDESLRRGSLAARVEEVCLNAWPALQEIHYDGWLIRLADGHTRRVNSVNVLREGLLPIGRKVAYCEAVYRRHALRPYFRILSTARGDLEETLSARGYRAEDETTTLFMDFADRPPPPPEFAVELTHDAPSGEWISACARFHETSPSESAKLQKILQQLALPGVFAAVRDASGIRSLAKGAVHDRIVCVNLVATDEAARRRGYSRACVSAILNWAREETGAQGACLQVLSTNAPAIRLYETLGFGRELYRYHYRTPA